MLPRLALFLMLISNDALAIDHRWTIGFAQGTVEASIRNAAGSSVAIYCPGGQIDTTPGMFIHVDKIRPGKDEQIDVQIVVDGRRHAFILREIQFEASGRSSFNALHALIDHLVKAKGKHFTVEFPKFGMAERFSLLDARVALGSAADFLSDCEK